MDGEVSSIALGGTRVSPQCPFAPLLHGEDGTNSRLSLLHLHPTVLGSLASLLCCIPTRKRRAHLRSHLALQSDSPWSLYPGVHLLWAQTYNEHRQTNIMAWGTLVNVVTV